MIDLAEFGEVVVAKNVKEVVGCKCEPKPCLCHKAKLTPFDMNIVERVFDFHSKETVGGTKTKIKVDITDNVDLIAETYADRNQIEFGMITPGRQLSTFGCPTHVFP